MLGVTFTNHLSMSDHVRDVIARCGQTLYALKVLRTHGMSDDSLREIYKAVVLAKLMYASPAWWGFTAASDIDEMHVVNLPGLTTWNPASPQLGCLDCDKYYQ